MSDIPLTDTFLPIDSRRSNIWRWVRAASVLLGVWGFLGVMVWMRSGG